MSKFVLPCAPCKTETPQVVVEKHVQTAAKETIITNCTQCGNDKVYDKMKSKI